jgi:SAM-dependent methyltransferase
MTTMFFKSRIIDHSHIHEIVNQDPYISIIYREIYNEFFQICGSQPKKNMKVLEIGGGDMSYVRDYWANAVITEADDYSTDPSVITSVYAEELPFSDAHFDIVVAKDSLHHFKNPIIALNEIERVLKPNGRFIVSEPFWSPLGRFVYRYIHPEPWKTRIKSLLIDSDDLWDSNQALLYLLSSKFKNEFSRKCPNLKIKLYYPTYGISYLLSGGVHSRTPISSNFLIKINKFERKSRRLLKYTGLNVIAVFAKES